MPRKKTDILGMTVEWLGHSSLALYGEKTVYIDPFSEVMEPADIKGDVIISSHPHRDHFDVAAINRLVGSNTEIVLKRGCDNTNLTAGKITEIDPGEIHNIGGITIRAVPAYNVRRFRSPGNPFHPEGFGMGVIFEIGNIKCYYTGDTDCIPMMTTLATEQIDIAFMPIGGKFTMDLEEAVEAAALIQSKIVVPIHFNHLPGTEADPLAFKEKTEQVTNSLVVLL